MKALAGQNIFEITRISFFIMTQEETRCQKIIRTDSLMKEMREAKEVKEAKRIQEMKETKRTKAMKKMRERKAFAHRVRTDR